MTPLCQICLFQITYTQNLFPKFHSIHYLFTIKFYDKKLHIILEKAFSIIKLLIIKSLKLKLN